MTSLSLLHFADAHIDMVTGGRYDEVSGLPLRVLDFLHSLDRLVEYALEHKVDLVVFAGDAYRNHRPQTRFQQEWQKRVMRLASADIPVILLVGNHDATPALPHAHAMQEFTTLHVPNVIVPIHPQLLSAEQLNGLPMQMIALPWLFPQKMMAREEMARSSEEEIRLAMESAVEDRLERLKKQLDPALPTLLVAHATVSGATLGSERQIMLGRDMQLSLSLLADPAYDYVALGHIHKHQSLNGQNHPPVVYAGSIERVDFGEKDDSKGFVHLHLSKGKTDWRFIPLPARRFVDVEITPESAETFMDEVMAQLPAPQLIHDAICRIQLHYPQEWEPLLDEQRLGNHYREAFSLQVKKIRPNSARSRLGDTVAVETLTPAELLDTYWRTIGLAPDEAAALQQLAKATLGLS